MTQKYFTKTVQKNEMQKKEKCTTPLVVYKKTLSYFYLAKDDKSRRPQIRPSRE